MAERRWAESAPDPEGYRALRAACGLGPRSPEAAERGLAQGLFAVTVWDGHRLIGMGRVVGDGGCFAQIVDIAVHPDRQGAGLGAEILARLLTWCEAHLPKSCYLSLIANPAAASLYRRAGFDEALGMGRTMS